MPLQPDSPSHKNQGPQVASQRFRLFLELLILFVLIPTLLNLLPFKRIVFVALWAGAIGCYVFLRRDAAFGVLPHWNKAAINWQNLKPILVRFALSASVITVGILLFIPERLLDLPMENPRLWVSVLIFYPLLSVYPQEIIYRSFFMRRYKAAFSKPYKLVIVNALLFGYAHLIFHHWLTIVLSVIGGVMFAQTYLKTRSLGLVCIEHVLYGCWIFTIGLGYYFYTGVAR